MSAFGKSALFNGENIASETVKEDFETNSTVENQVSKFDNSYSTNEKLQELYNEFDKITLDENKIKEFTQVKVNAVSSKVPFRVALAMSTVLIVTLLLAFLCVYNIFVINGMSNNISYLQEEVATAEYDLANSQGLYERLTSTDNIKNELGDMGYSQIPSSNVVAVDVPDKVEVSELQGQTNWFDAFCNFLSRIFG